MKASIIICIVALVMQMVWAKTCTMDYECGTAPYGQCSDSVNDCSATNRGVAIDESNNVIYFAALCRSGSSNSNNITIKKVSINGGLANKVFTELETNGPDYIDKVFTVANGVLYFDRIERQPGSVLGTFNLKTGQKGTATQGPGFFEGQLEIANGASYTCQLEFGNNNNYSIVRYPGVIGQSTASGNKLYVIGSSQCGPVRRGTGSKVIFTVYSYTVSQEQSTTVKYTTSFYNGTVTGSKTLPAASFSVAGQVTDFDIDSTGSIIVYGTQNGLFKRVGTTITTLSTESITGVAIYGQKIYYNNGVTIRSVTFDGQTKQDLVKQSGSGMCTCRSGFYGDNCQSCDGQTQWDGGSPSCVSVNSAGVPNSCMYDYQCGNAPYSVCYSNTCQCRENFSGAHCDECTGGRTITFDNGMPICS